MSIKYNPMARKNYQKRVNALREQQSGEAVLARALHFYASVKNVNADLISSPAQQISALEAYIEDLKQLEEELKDEYGAEAEKTISIVGYERRKAIQQIGYLRLDVIKPGVV